MAYLGTKGKYLGERLKIAREEKGYTKSKLAELVNTDYNSILRYEKGTRKPSTTMLIKLADELGVTAEWLSSDEEWTIDDPFTKIPGFIEKTDATKFLGKRIKFAREYRNLTLKDLSKKCAEIDSTITYNGMWQWETGRRTPKYETVRIIAQVLDVMPTYFLEAEYFNEPVEYIQPYLRLDEEIKSDILEEILTLANFYSITLPVEYGDGTLANEKFIDLDELEMIITSVLEKIEETEE